MKKRLAGWVVLSLLLAAAISGCFYREPVRHLGADAVLIVAGQSTRKDVLAYFGEPDERRTSLAGEETWVYQEARKSVLRKTPYIGERIGDQEYDILTVIFQGDVVRSSTYRLYSEDELQDKSPKE